MPPALLFESSGQFRFVHRSQLNKRQTQVGYYNRKPIQLKSVPPSGEQHAWSCSCHPVQVRMAERSKAPDSRRCTFLSRGISGLRMEAWVRIPLLTWPFDFKLQYPNPFDRPLSPAAELRIVPLELTKDHIFKRFWRCRGTIPGPDTCEACALPLSYIPKLQSQWGLSREKGLIAKSSAAFEFQFQTKRDIYWGENSCYRGYSSVVEHLTADQEVPGSNPGAPLQNSGKQAVSFHAQTVC